MYLTNAVVYLGRGLTFKPNQVKSERIQGSKKLRIQYPEKAFIVVSHPKTGGNQAFFSVALRHIKGNVHNSQIKEVINVVTLEQNLNSFQQVQTQQNQLVMTVVWIVLGVLCFFFVIMAACFFHQFRKFYSFKHIEKHEQVDDHRSIFENEPAVSF